MKKSTAISISFLSAIAAGCSACTAHAHLNAAGQCVNDSGAFIDQRACTGTGGYYGGTHYVFTGSGNSSSSTVRGVLGSSGEGHAGGSAE